MPRRSRSPPPPGPARHHAPRRAEGGAAPRKDLPAAHGSHADDARAHGSSSATHHQPQQTGPLTLEGCTKPIHVAFRISQSASLVEICDLLEWAAPDFAIFDPLCIAAAVQCVSKYTAPLQRSGKPVPSRLPKLFEKLVDKARLQIFGARELAGMVLALAAAGFFSMRDLQSPSRLLLSALVSQIEQRGLHSNPPYKPLDVSNLCWGLAQANFHDSTAVLDLVADFIVKKKLPISGFRPQELANLIWAYGRLGHRRFDIFDQASVEIVSKKLSGFTTHDVASLLWAFATLDYLNSDVLPTVHSYLSATPPEDFSEMDAPDVVWWLGCMQISSSTESSLPPLVARYVSYLSKYFNSLTAKGVCASVSGLSKLGHLDESAVVLLARRFLALRLSDCTSPLSPLDLGNLLSGIATKRTAALKEVFDRALAYAQANAAELDVARFPTAVLLTWLRAFADAQYTPADSPVVKALVKEACARVGAMSSMQLAACVWACSSAGINDPSIYTAVGVECEARNVLLQFEPYALTRLVWGYIQAGAPCPPAIWSAVPLRGLDNFSLDDLAILVWCFASQAPPLSLADAQALSVSFMVECQKRELRDASAQSIVSLFWALAVFGLDATTFLDRLVAALVSIDRAQLSCQDMGNIAWAASKLGVTDVGFCAKFLPGAR